MAVSVMLIGREALDGPAHFSWMNGGILSPSPNQNHLYMNSIAAAISGGQDAEGGAVAMDRNPAAHLPYQ